jgi:hypothetical protein
VPPQTYGTPRYLEASATTDWPMVVPAPEEVAPPLAYAVSELARVDGVVAPAAEAPALALAELEDWPWTAPWMAERMSPKSPCSASVWIV